MDSRSVRSVLLGVGSRTAASEHPHAHADAPRHADADRDGGPFPAFSIAHTTSFHHLHAYPVAHCLRCPYVPPDSDAGSGPSGPKLPRDVRLRPAEDHLPAADPPARHEFAGDSDPDRAEADDANRHRSGNPSWLDLR